MKTKLLSIIALVFAGVANASSFTWETWIDRDPDNGSYLDYLNEYSDVQYTNTFNISDAGYSSDKHVITEIDVKFAFADDSFKDTTESVDIWLGDTKIWNNKEVDGSHEYGFDWISKDVTNINSVYSDMLDGEISYKVKIQNLKHWWKGAEDTYLKVAKITVKGYSINDSGSTVALLGISLVGFAGLRRRFAK